MPIDRPAAMATPSAVVSLTFVRTVKYKRYFTVEIEVLKELLTNCQSTDVSL